ncbi:MAG: LOG family protein [Nanoarchaeota archaeon]|nr:LOG family protein [Nanoarchaeota archaeon]
MKWFITESAGEKEIKAALGRYQRPFIGVIGATSPGAGYKKEDGIKAGYELRKFIENRAGTLFTGGVEGVGTDTYTGISRYCVEQGVKKGSMPSDRFFVLIPHNISVRDPENFQSRTSISYNPPEIYNSLSTVIGNKGLGIVRAGEEMGERREYVAEIADALIVLNGGLGTLDEAYGALKKNKPLIVLPQTGGIAADLKAVKDDTLPLAKRMQFLKNSFIFNAELVSHIHLAQDITEATQKLEELL